MPPGPSACLLTTSTLAGPSGFRVYYALAIFAAPRRGVLPPARHDHHHLLRRRAMGSIRTAGAAAVLAAGLLLQQGCQTRRQPATREPAQPSLSASQRLREELLRADPNARVGIVSSALHDAQLVAVRDVPVEGFAEGDTISFLDGNGR